MNDLERYAEFNFDLRQNKKMADDIPADFLKNRHRYRLSGAGFIGCKTV